jgi:hypothetical protein
VSVSSIEVFFRFLRQADFLVSTQQALAQFRWGGSLQLVQVGFERAASMTRLYGIVQTNHHQFMAGLLLGGHPGASLGDPFVDARLIFMCSQQDHAAHGIQGRFQHDKGGLGLCFFEIDHKR